MTSGLDPTDLKLLQLLQADARMTEKQLAAQVFRSAPSVHERLEKLRERGFIKGFTALLDRDLIGQPVLVITHIRLEKQAAKDLDTFESQVAALPEVTFLLHVSGAWNFILHITAPTPQAYFNFIMEHISAQGNIGAIESCFVMKEVKAYGGFKLV